MSRKIIFSFLVVLISLKTFAQTATYLMPFQGFKVVENGLTCDGIKALINDEQWISNHVSLNKTAKIKVMKPRGFVLNSDSTALFGVSALLLSSKGDTLLYSPDIFGGMTEGYNIDMISYLSVKYELTNLQVGDEVMMKAIYFDLKSNRNISVEGKMIVAPENEPQTTDSHYNYTLGTDYKWSSSGVECKDMKLLMDMSLDESKPTIFKVGFNVIGATKVDLENSTLDMQLLYKDGSIKTKQNISGIKRVVKEGENNSANTMILFPAREGDIENVQSIWIRLTDTTKKWVVAGSVKL